MWLMDEANALVNIIDVDAVDGAGEAGDVSSVTLRGS